MLLLFSLIVLQVIIFGALIFFFRKIMTQNVSQATQHLEELNKENTEKEKMVTRHLELAKQEAQQLLIKAQEEADAARADILKQAQEQRDTLLAQARHNSEELIQQADKSRQQLLAEIQERIAKEAVQKACELIARVLPEDFRREVHERWVNDLLSKGFTQLEHLRIPEGRQEAKVVTALALDDGLRAKIAERLKAALSRDIVLQEEVQERLVAGLIISVGSLVLDGSLKTRIEERAR